MNKFKRCPIQPTPGNGILCESCQHRIIPEPCQARLKEKRKANTICIPLHKPARQLVNGKWQNVYPILERTTHAGKPIPTDLIQENYLDTEFQETCNLYLSEFPSESHLPNCPVCNTNHLEKYRDEPYIRCECCHTGFNISETFDIETASRIPPPKTVNKHKKQLIINLRQGK